MTDAVDQTLIDDAVRYARAGGDATLELFDSPRLAIDTKSDGTPVTDADRAAEDTIRSLISADHPEDSVVGEERDDVDGTSGRRWIIDPIDGTKAFTRGVPLYSTLVAVYDEHGPAVGVIHLPALDETVFAGRGRGCWRHRRGELKRVRAQRRSDADRPLDGAYVMTSGLGSWHPDAVAALQSAGALIRTWGDAYGYALVATGRADAMIDPEAALWDLAPMPTIIGEAGGHFTSIDGRPDPDAGSGIAAADAAIAAEIAALFGGT